jgi:hypothetical protein
MARIAVYRFSWWDPNSGKTVASSTFATLKAIKIVDGRNLEDSRLLVEASELDSNGFYRPPPVRKAGASGAG